MNTLTLMVGLPASGKSTYAKQLENKDTIVLSSDSIRAELWGDERDQRSPQVVFDTLYTRAIDALKRNINVVIDATNVTKADRANALKPFVGLDIKRRAIVINTPINICIQQNKLRERTVPDDVIKRFYDMYEEPTIDEGFDEIIMIKR